MRSAAANTTRSMTVPAGPTLSNSVRPRADPNWTELIPTKTSAVGGTDSARRLVLVLERNVLERVHGAEVRPARVECRPDLGLGQLHSAFGAALLDDGLDPAAFLEVGHQSFCLVSMWVTGTPARRSTRLGRSIFNHL